jgi:seryl-tRNA synthetase
VNCHFFCFALNKVDVSWILIVRDSSHNHSSTIEEAHSVLKKLAIILDTVSKIDNQSKT